MAAELQLSTPASIIFVPSAFEEKGARAEIDLYKERLLAEGASEDAILLVSQGLDTVEQCELALSLAEEEAAKLVAITCHVQFKRVRYMLDKPGVEHVIAHGTPNLWLRFTSLILTYAFPVLDRLGLRETWKRRVANRRSQGKQ